MTWLKKIKSIAFLLALTCALSGCLVIRNETMPPSADPKISFGPSIGGQKEVIRTFQRTGRATYWFLYLIPKNNLDGYELARRELRQGEAIQNLRITTKSDLIDFLVGFIALVFGTWRIDVEGEVVKA